MKTLRFILLPLSVCAVLAGCNASDSASNPPPVTPKDEVASTANAEKAKCEGCGSDFPKAELVSHDGKMMCKACIDAHGH